MNPKTRINSGNHATLATCAFDRAGLTQEVEQPMTVGLPKALLHDFRGSAGDLVPLDAHPFVQVKRIGPERAQIALSKGPVTIARDVDISTASIGGSREAALVASVLNSGALIRLRGVKDGFPMYDMYCDEVTKLADFPGEYNLRGYMAIRKGGMVFGDFYGLSDGGTLVACQGVALERRDGRSCAVNPRTASDIQGYMLTIGTLPESILFSMTDREQAITLVRRVRNLTNKHGEEQTLAHIKDSFS